MDIYNKFIILFIACYIVTYSHVIFGPTFNFIKYFDSIYYFSSFLIIPLLITFLISKRYKCDSIKVYFIIFIIQWILFLNVNPYPLQQDNKFSIMKLVPKEYRPQTQFMLSEIYHNDFTYPIIVKPICCSGDSDDVHVINNSDELNVFLYRKNIDINEYMVQEYLEDTIEIGLLYEKYPFEKEGRILEIVEKVSNQKVIEFEHATRRYHNYLIHNKRINKMINEITNLIPGMNVARYDIRVKNIEDLERGDFTIIEINGTMGWSLEHFIDSTWYFRRLYIGLVNTITFNGYSIIELPLVMYKSFYSMVTCFDYENLFSLYS